MKMLKIALSGAALFILFGFSLSFSSHKKLQPQGNLVTVPLAELKPQKAAFYQVNIDGVTVRFFAVKGADGRIRTALDACDVCFRERKGYEQKGVVMLCRNCGLTFPIDRIGPSSIGGCNPHFLPSVISGDRLQIQLSELRSGERFFR